VGKRVNRASSGRRWIAGRRAAWAGLWALGVLALGLAVPAAWAQGSTAKPEAKAAPQRANLPPRVIQAERFLAQRGWAKAGNSIDGRAVVRPGVRRAGWRMSAAGVLGNTSATATWQALGPAAVQTPEFGLVTGRVSALALDPSDATGNRLYLGTTGGGVWVANNAGASDPSLVAFTPLTDTVAALSVAADASISIGALTVQPGGTGVILAGTGDPNDVLDSYYGAGILRSADGGNTWSLIQTTVDAEQGLSGQDFSFAGEGFAGFAWSTANPQRVVAAVSQAYEGTLVDAERPQGSYEGLYYSSDSGATWHLATITDGSGADVQGPLDTLAVPYGNAATSVVWNPVRQLFVAAVRYHGYYQSADGITWTRMAAQPGSGLTKLLCPTNLGGTGSIACPIFRGTLAVNPLTGDTFAWTVDAYNQDQGLWQDQCAASRGSCGNQAIAFAQRWSTTALETSTSDGPATLENGDYTLALAAVPSSQDTLLLAGTNDLWKCSLAMGCVWRNTTNVVTCPTSNAQVGAYQHALAWSTANPLEIFVGNDSGLWRSADAIGETGQVCSAADSTHFQNLNGGLGSLAEVESMSQAGASPYTMMTGLGVNGTAGVKSGTGPTADWPLILGGEGGPVAIDPGNSAKWYVNNGAGVSIHLCSQSANCTAAAFGSSPVVNNADVGGDGATMTTPAPFLVDPLDSSQLLIGTCRVWRGPADGIGWGGSNAVSPILASGAAGVSCNGDATIRSMAAMALASGSEVVYVGMYGSANGGSNLPGHVLSATINPASSGLPAWTDLTLNPVTNDTLAMNYFGLDISSIFIDSHDPTGNTVYVTVEGVESPTEEVKSVYRSTDGGAHWAQLTANLSAAPASSVVVDPQDANTVYLATDAGVFFTTRIGSCAQPSSNCWSAFGSGLPGAPVVQLSAAPANASAQVLVAATYGRGVWQSPLWTTGTGLTTVAASPVSLTFASQVFGTASSAQTITLQNTGSLALTPTAIAMSGDFSETDNCQNATVVVGGSCAIQVTFTPTATGPRTGQMTIGANVFGGQLTVEMSGTGAPAGAVSLTPATVNFGPVEVGTTSASMQVEAGNSSAAAVPITGVAVTSPFTIASNSCGTSSLAPNTDCQVQVAFSPTAPGPVAGTLTFTDGAGTQYVNLTGTGEAAPTDILNPAASLAFPGTVVGQLSTAQTVSLTNTGGEPLESIVVSASGAFQTSNNCTTQLAGPASCSISVVFAPSQAGPAAGTLTVSDALRTQTVALSGTGLLPPAFSVIPSSLNFLAQQPGVASQPQTLTVSNTGGAPMANVGFQITGPAASSFTTGVTTCGAALANGSSCTVQVTFTAAAAGGSVATLTISSSTLGVTAASVPLNGTAQVLSGLGVSPAQLTFPAVSTGQASAAQTVTISNTSSFAFNSLSLAVSAQFSLTQNTCASSLAAGASCTAAVVFVPTGNAGATGTLTVSSPSVATQATVALTGQGGILVTPAAISFATTGVNTASAAQTVTVTNLGTTNTLTGLALAVPAGFQLVNNNCPATLGPGTSCTAGVEFVPASAGAQTGSLTATTSTVQAPPVALSGTGFDFTVAISGASSQTVAGGQTANYTLVLTPNAAQGTFAFQCGTLPANALCIFNPSTETLGTGVQGNVTVEISTGSGSASNTAGPAVWRMLPLACGLLLLPLALGRRRKALLLVALLAVLAGGVSSCTSSGGGGSGGGSGGQSKTGATPPGTYTISVTATSTGVAHPVTVTLTVD
jgi:hypothetical protein